MKKEFFSDVSRPDVCLSEPLEGLTDEAPTWTPSTRCPGSWLTTPDSLERRAPSPDATQELPFARVLGPAPTASSSLPGGRGPALLWERNHILCVPALGDRRYEKPRR